MPGDEEKMESMAVCDEMMLEEYLEKGTVGKEMISRAVAARKIFRAGSVLP